MPERWLKVWSQVDLIPSADNRAAALINALFGCVANERYRYLFRYDVVDWHKSHSLPLKALGNEC